MQRRTFLQTGAWAAATSLLVPHVHAQSSADDAPAEELPIALIGVGYQGRALLSAALNIPGVRVRAVCDVWNYAQNYGKKFLASRGQEATVYEDYREMLAKEQGLAAVLVATPDFVHAEQTNACLEAGLHVYCEPMMADNLQAAQSMVTTMRRTGRLLQIGYQRRSNARYRHARERLLLEAKLPGRLTAAQTQWAQEARDLRGWPKRFLMQPDALQRHQYEDMSQFRNWMWYPRYCGGPYCAFVSQQLDVCQWFLDGPPRSVLASGGQDYFRDRLTPDTVLAVYEYPREDGVVRVACSMYTSTSGDGMRQIERFLGSEGSLQLSENPRWTSVGRESSAPDWDTWVKKDYLVKQEVTAVHEATSEDTDVHVSGDVEKYQLPMVTIVSNCQAHLENFVAAVRGKESLACPADVAWPSQVAAFKAMEAIQTGATVRFSEADFTC